MRVFMLALMLVVLPLRGWVGDAMALGQSAHVDFEDKAASEQVISADCAHGHGTTHQGHQAAPAISGDLASADLGASDRHDHGGCTACQICHSATLGTVSLVALVDPAPGHRPRATSIVDTSAERVLGDKPPIL